MVDQSVVVNMTIVALASASAMLGLVVAIWSVHHTHKRISTAGEIKSLPVLWTEIETGHKYICVGTNANATTGKIMVKYLRYFVDADHTSGYEYCRERKEFESKFEKL